MKKAVAMLMCAAMAAGVLAGCGTNGQTGGTAGTENASQSETEKGNTGTSANAKSGDMVTLNLYIPTLANFSEDAIQEVQDALNAYAADKYGWQVKLNYSEIGNFEQNINLAMTTDQLDVTCYFNSSGQLLNYAHNHQLLDITDRFAEASDDFKNIFTDAELASSTIDGKLYGVPRNYQYGGTECVVMNKDLVKEMNIDVSTIDDMDSLGKVLYQVHEKHPEIYALVPQSSAEMTWCRPFIRGIGLTNYAYTEYTENNDSTELKSVFDTESFKKFCSYTRQWYQDGLIMPDAVSNTQEGSSMVTAGAAFACLHNCDIDPLDTVYPNTVCSPNFFKPFANPTDIGNLQYGISANSKHPDESFSLLTALYTDKDFETLLAYGIEGKHYVINADGKADYPEGMTAETEPYGGFSATATYPNYLILPVKASATVDDYQKTVTDWNNSVKTNPATGFVFDTSKDTDFITAYKNTEDKYLNALLTGSIAYDDTIDQIHSELDQLGFADVLSRTQTALDQYLANK